VTVNAGALTRARKAVRVEQDDRAYAHRQGRSDDGADVARDAYLIERYDVTRY
jgi:hypothetical protein